MCSATDRCAATRRPARSLFHYLDASSPSADAAPRATAGHAVVRDPREHLRRGQCRGRSCRAAAVRDGLEGERSEHMVKGMAQSPRRRLLLSLPRMSTVRLLRLRRGET